MAFTGSEAILKSVITFLVNSMLQNSEQDFEFSRILHQKTV